MTSARERASRVVRGPERSLRDLLVLVFALALASRIALLVLGEVWLASPLADQAPEGRYIAELGDQDSQLDRLSLGDPNFYRSIRDGGYEERPFTSTPMANWAFSPAWPYLWRAVDAVAPAQLGAALVNALLFALACVFVLLALRRHVSERAALLATLLLIAAPGAQFTVRPGPESLFLAASAVALWAAGERRWAWVGPAAAVAALSRPQGALLLVPLVVMAVGQLRDSTGRRPAPAVLATALVLPIAGLAAFAVHLDRLTGNPLANLGVQKAWDNESAFPGSAAARGLLHLLRDGQGTDYYGFNLVPLSLLALAVATVLIVRTAWKRELSGSLVAYAVVNLLVLLTRSQTQAALRYVVMVFPLFAMAAVPLVRRPRAWGIGTICALLALQVTIYLAAVQGATWALT
jgi:hypothetical protein